MPSNSVINTKLLPPAKRSMIIERPRLYELLDVDDLRKLTLITAPAGFGKTTLMGQWFSHLDNIGYQCSWLSLDHDDHDMFRFLHHLIASIKSVNPAFGNIAIQQLDRTEILDITDILPQLINEMAVIKSRLVMFLDDFHYINNEEICHFIDLLINLSPNEFHLVIAARVKPSLPLANLKVRNELIELNANNLRFDNNESENFLIRTHGLQLSSSQLEELRDHSEGWVAGLQLASLSLKNVENCNDYIESFSGNLRDISDYLAADVLNQQSDNIKIFLLRTSILNRFNADVCKLLTGESDSQAMLEYLEEQNLFILPLDQERIWYRYHHLFHEFLLGQLRRQYPADIVKLYKKATDWFSQEGLAGEAVDYALLSGDLDKAVYLVESQVDEEMMAGRMPRVNAWINRIPEQVRKTHPRLLIAKCTALYHMSRSHDAAATLEQLKNSINNCGNETDIVIIQDQIRIIEAGIAICRDDVDSILEPLRLPFKAPTNFEKGVINNIKGYAYAALSQYDKASQALNDAHYYHQLCNAQFGMVYSDCFHGMADLAKGNLQSCYAKFDNYDSSTSSSGETYILPVPAIMKGIVLYEWNRLNEAFDLLRFNLPLVEQVGHSKLLTLGYITLAKIIGAKGDNIGATRYFDHALNLGTSIGAPYKRLKILVESERIRYLITNERINEAIDLGDSMEIGHDQPDLPGEWERVSCLNLLIWSRLQIATGLADRCLPVMDNLIGLASQVKRYKRVIECQILQAIALSRLNKTEDAKNKLLTALASAEPNRSLRCFVDEGPETGQLINTIRQSRDKSVSPEIHNYVNAIHEAFPVQANTDSDNRQNLISSLLEPLNDREIDILKLIARGLSNHVIADELCISENTVKWHMKNIFAKLDVNNRTAAVVAAQQQQLL